MNTAAVSDLQFLAGGGEMGELTRSKDWSNTVVGDPETWPQSLRTTLGIILNSKFPMFLWWGPELVCFYNDAYRPSLGINGKHPSILGMKAVDAWPEIWDIIKPLIDKSLLGEAIWFEDLLVPIYRNGNIEDVYWTFSYSPVKDESDEVAGVLVTCTETTEKVNTLKSLQESEERFRAMADNIPNLAWMAKADGWIYWYNKKWYEYTGTTPEQMEGWGWQSVHDPGELPQVMEKWQASIDSGEEFEMVFPLKGADGKFRHFLTRVLPVRNTEGKIHQWFGSNTDISRQKQIEEALKESEQRFKNSVSQAPVGITILRGKEYVVEMANDAYMQLVDRKAAGFVGRPIFDSLPEVKDFVKALLDGVINTGVPYHGNELPIPVNRYGKNEICYFDFLYHPLKEEDGNISGIIVTVAEVTDQVIARKKIEESESRFRSLIGQAPMAMVVFKGPEHIIEIVNSAMLNRWNKTEQEVINKRVLDIFPEIKDQKFPALLDEVYKTGKGYREAEAVSHIHSREGQHTFYIDFEYSPLFEMDGSVSGIIATVHDVTEKVEARKKIEESEERYHNLIYSSPSAIGILYGEDLVITIANDAIIQIWGKGKEIMGKAYFEALPELAEQGYKEVFANVYKTGIPFNAVETPVNILQDGEMTLKYYNFLLYPQRNINGEIDGIGIIATEVTSQALLNNKVKESEKRFRLLADAMPQHIWTSDPQGNLNYFNQSVYDYSGLTPEQLNKDGWIQIVHPDDREENIKQWSHAIATGQDFLLEHRFRRHDGVYRWQLSRAIPQKDENGRIQMWVGTSTDIQDIKELDQQKDSFLSMASHELKTPVTTIKAYGQIAEAMLEKKGDKETLAMINKMGTQVNKLTNLIGDLLDITRIQKGKLQYHEAFFDLNEVVNNVVDDMQRTSVTHRIQNNTGEDIKIYGDKEKISQVLNNLISNAIKYSPGADKIIVSTQPKDNGVEISVKDFGIGIPAKEQQHVFEQFYRVTGNNQSTFPGMGIGLFICSEITKMHGGKIWADSVMGEGSTFHIWLPGDHREGK